jgi:transglutaminase-like putative cysteine protease
MTSEPQAPGAPAVILYKQVDRDDNIRTSHEDNYVRIKILTEEGRKYADVELEYLKERTDISGIKARTIRPDGSIANFDGKVFDKTIAKAKGIKYLAKTFTLPDVQVGSIIEYSYTRNFAEYYIFDSHWVLSDELFTKHAKFSLKPYSGEGWSVRWTWQYLPEGTVTPKEGPDSIVRLEAVNIPAFRTEDFMPPADELKARVDFIYSDEYVDTKEPDKFWRNTGKKLNGKLENFAGKRKAMEQAVAQIVSPGDSPEVKLQKIYVRVQQLRNTTYEVEKTQQEQKREKQKDAENVEDLWKLGYGNGRDLTWLFLGLARAAGLEAYGVWTADRQHYFFHPAIMDSQRLDANVVLVKLNGNDLYFDPGSAFIPYGFLPWEETGVEGLKLDKDGGSWVTTVMPASSMSKINRTANLKLVADTGSLEGKLIVNYTGLEASRRRREERNEDETERKKFLEDEVREFVPSAIDVELTNKPDWAASTDSLVAEFDLKVPGWVSGAGRRALLPVGLFGATEKHLFDHAERAHPIYFDFLFQRVDDITVELPDGWKVTTIPDGRDDPGKVIAFSTKAGVENNKLHLSRKLDVNTPLLDQKYYGALRNLFMAVRASDEQQIVLQPGATAAVN